jgi:hypothetical protein
MAKVFYGGAETEFLAHYDAETVVTPFLRCPHLSTIVFSNRNQWGLLQLEGLLEAFVEEELWL